DDSGEGSLRHGIESADGPRTIVFEVSGIIDLNEPLNIAKPYLTIAGQTAPGSGITLKGWTTHLRDTHDVIVRFIRFRPGDIHCPEGCTSHAFRVWDSHAVIIAHVSASRGIGEVLSLSRGVTDSTVQWALIAESLYETCHHKGIPHGFASNISWV